MFFLLVSRDFLHGGTPLILCTVAHGFPDFLHGRTQIPRFCAWVHMNVRNLGRGKLEFAHGLRMPACNLYADKCSSATVLDDDGSTALEENR